MDIARQIHIYYDGPRFTRPETNYPINFNGTLPHNNRPNGTYVQEIARRNRASLGENFQESFEIVPEDSSEALDETNPTQVEVAPSMCIIQ